MATLTAAAAPVIPDPIGALASAQRALTDRSRHEVGPLVVFIVAAAALLALGMVLAAAVSLYCIHRGANLEWYTQDGWKFWFYHVACRFW